MAKKKSDRLKKGFTFKGFLKGLYIVIFAFSLVIVVGFAAYKLLAPPPAVDNEVVLFPGGVAPDPSVDLSGSSDSQGNSNSTPDSLVVKRREGVYTCLLIGKADIGGTDTIMLGVFDTKAKTASLISIPRDTVVHVNGADRKINAVESVGGTELLVKTVSNMLAVPVDFYVEVDTYAFKAIVDTIGGVYFNVPVNMNYDDPTQNLHIHVNAGYQLLDGNKALGVMRCRNAYANADIGRGQTQRAFLAALVKQTITPSNVTKVTELIGILNTYVESDMPVNNMVYFATQAIGMDLDTNLTSAVLTGTWISPYYVLDDQAVLDLVNSLGIYDQTLPMNVLNIRHP